jgi:hypothetical protein
MLKRLVETVWIRVHFGFLLLGDISCPTYIGGVEYTISTISMVE